MNISPVTSVVVPSPSPSTSMMMTTTTTGGDTTTTTTTTTPLTPTSTITRTGPLSYSTTATIMRRTTTASPSTSCTSPTPPTTITSHRSLDYYDPPSLLPTPTGFTTTTPITNTTPTLSRQDSHLHAPDATPPLLDPALEPISTIRQHLLNLRGAPPGTMATHLTQQDILLLCRHAKSILLQQPMLLELEAPMKICGDIHGQYTDLLRVLEYGGFPPVANYLFLGDYVDRGKQSVETICLLLTYKIQYPHNFFLLRGNHESAGINRIYGFYDECKRRYSIKLWKVFCDVFNGMPVAALIDDKILCMHGGLSPELKHLQQIANLPRPCDIPDRGLLCDLLWSDPSAYVETWADNDRGVSYVFGATIVNQFLQSQDLDLIVRAHQVVEDGYEFFAGRRLVTLFSAPNYCGEFDNAGGMISVDENLLCSFQILKPSGKSNSGGIGGGRGSGSSSSSGDGGGVPATGLPRTVV